MVVSRARIIHGIDNSVHILLARLGRAKYKVGGMAVKRNSGLRTHSRKHQLQCLLGISRGTISSRASASLSPLFARTRRPTRARIGGKNRLVKMRATTCNRRVEEWSIDYWFFFFFFVSGDEWMVKVWREFMDWVQSCGLSGYYCGGIVSRPLHFRKFRSFHVVVVKFKWIEESEDLWLILVIAIVFKS